MTKQIITNDPRLFLFQVMEYGFDKKLFDEIFLNNFKKQGMQMSFAFAKRYYSVVYEAYLRQASHCVLGIMNIGLLEISEKNMNDATGFLLQKGYVGAFREGWTRVSDLASYASNSEKNTHKTEFEWERDFSESFSAEPGREWIGYDEYQINRLTYCNNRRGENEAG